MEENYFTAVEHKVYVSPCDIDMLRWALNNVDWSTYDSEDFGDESECAAGEHLDFILQEFGADTDWP